ncbi:MAG: hypothetical protein DMD48_07165 [Gemmatimonadetes bacterium]|nr:MAG: hypothetical protein DMD48_07165 [Gemmatimonadota bacterium]
MSAPCSTRAPVPVSVRRSYARRLSARAAKASARSSTKSATSLSSPSNPSSSQRWRRAWLIGLVVSVALLGWVLYKINVREVWADAQRADPLWLLLTVVVATLTFPVRSIRWRLILRDQGGRPFPWLPLWHATTIGFMANNLLPARAGEVARGYVASRQLPVRFSTALASIAVERVFDALIMLGLMAVAIAAPSFPAAAGAHRPPAAAGTSRRSRDSRGGGAARGPRRPQESGPLRRRRFLVAGAVD